ncbi:MAG: aconitase X swivel domain-containing protein [Nitrososphaerales archaeon]
MITGDVVYSGTPIAFLQGVDPERGVVTDKDSEIYNIAFKNKILVFPNAVGSSVGAYVIYRLKKNNVAPLAMINETSDIITASGCAVAGIALLDMEKHDIKLLKNKAVKIDSKKSTIEIKSRS